MVWRSIATWKFLGFEGQGQKWLAPSAVLWPVTMQLRVAFRHHFLLDSVLSLQRPAETCAPPFRRPRRLPRGPTYCIQMSGRVHVPLYFELFNQLKKQFQPKLTRLTTKTLCSSGTRLKLTACTAGHTIQFAFNPGR